MVVGNLKANAVATEPILNRLMLSLNEQRPSSAAHTALADALITAPEHVPPKTRERLNLFTRSYWGSFPQD
jgi:5'-methylthioadenosine phosphorylase